jgi:hypothetical protein
MRSIASAMNTSGSRSSEDGEQRTEFDGGVPPAVHEIHARGLGKVECNAARLQADKKDGDMHVVHYDTVSISLVSAIQ